MNSNHKKKAAFALIAFAAILFGTLFFNQDTNESNTEHQTNSISTLTEVAPSQPASTTLPSEGTNTPKAIDTTTLPPQQSPKPTVHIKTSKSNSRERRLALKEEDIDFSDQKQLNDYVVKGIMLKDQNDFSEFLLDLIERGKLLPNQGINRMGKAFYTPLYSAMLFDKGFNKQKLNRFLDAGAHIQQSGKWSQAAASAPPEVVDVLLEHGLLQTNNKHETIAITAFKKGNTALIKHLHNKGILFRYDPLLKDIALSSIEFDNKRKKSNGTGHKQLRFLIDNGYIDSSYESYLAPVKQ